MINRVSALILILALAAGAGLRVARLASIPPGLDQDEACNGYDAYSIAATARDQHGNFLPIAMQAFNDYRMPLFDYSLVPLVRVLGLKPASVRLGAALWGILDMAAIALLARVILGWPGAAAAALLVALSPWHLPISRFGIETTAASATVNLGMACFFLWLARRGSRWLLLSGFFFGLSLYSYTITEAFTPLLVGWLTLLYWRELKQAGVTAVAALAAFVLLLTPQVVELCRQPAAMLARFSNASIFAQPGPVSIRMANFVASFVSYFTPSYLFLSGDRGDHWALMHPPGFGQLLPEQALLVTLGLLSLGFARWRKTAILLLGWLMLANLPAGLTWPLGAVFVEPNQLHGLPTPTILVTHRETVLRVLTPSAILAHPNLRRDVLAIAPWTLLSALGLVSLANLTRRRRLLGLAATGLILAGATFHGARFVRSYFRDYPVVAAPYFQFGMEQVIEAVNKLDNGSEPIVITNMINQPYIYVLFFKPYSPAQFQQARILQVPGLYGAVLAFDRYGFSAPADFYPRLEHGIFVFQGDESTPARPAMSVRYPGGAVAYNIVVK